MIVTSCLCICTEQQSASTERKILELQEQLVSHSKESDSLKEENCRLGERMLLHNSLRVIFTFFFRFRTKEESLHYVWCGEFSNEQSESKNNPKVVFVILNTILNNEILM